MNSVANGERSRHWSPTHFGVESHTGEEEDSVELTVNEPLRIRIFQCCGVDDSVKTICPRVEADARWQYCPELRKVKVDLLSFSFQAIDRGQLCVL